MELVTGSILLRSKSFGWQFRVECPELRGEEEEKEKKIIYLDTFSFSLSYSFFFIVVVFLCSLP